MYGITYDSDMPNTQFFICKLWQIVKEFTTLLGAATGRPNVYVPTHSCKSEFIL